MKYHLLLPVLLVINTLANGQANFVKAVVINNNGDSIHGNIDYRNWKNNPQTIHFINVANEKQAFDAASIKGFYIPDVNETYTSFTVEMDMITSDQSQAINNRLIDSPTLKKRAFLLQLVMHPAFRLYQFTGNHKEHFYYKKGNEEPVELIHHYLYDESSNRIQEIVTYKEQLSVLFATCPDVAGTSKTIKFRKKEIQNIILKFLQCSAPGSAVDIKKKDPVSLKFGIVAGLMLNKFKFKGTSQLADENYSGNVSPVFGVSLDAGLSRNRNKWHIVNEIIYKSYKTGSSFTRPYGNGYKATSNVDLDFSYAQINTILRYVFQSSPSLKPFINFGIGNAFIVAENKNNVHIEYSFGDEENVKAFDGPKRYEFSMLGGAGLIVRSIQLELRYGGNKKGFSPSYALDVNPSSLQFILTYQF
jgi:hypothetical protein